MQLRILVVDDDPSVAISYRDVLIRVGFSVEVTYSSRTALWFIEKEDFDLVLTDLNMPELHGDELAKRIKKIKPDLPVIIMSGDFDESDATNRAQALGADDGFTKLGGIMALRVKITKLLTRDKQPPAE